MGIPAYLCPGRGAGLRAGVAYRDGVAAAAVTATLICAGRDRRPVSGRMVPLTPDESRCCVHRSDGDRSCHGERPGTPPARGGHVVVRGSCRVGGHLGPGEPGELAGDRGDRLAPRFPVAGQVPVPAVQPPLRLPGPGQGARVRAGLPAAQGGPDRRGMLAGPGRLDQRGADRLQPALVMWPRRVRSPEEYSDGTSPVQDMNARAAGNRRQSTISAVRVSPPSSAMPR